MPNPVFLYSAQVVAILSVLLLAAGYLKTDPRASSARVFALIALMVVLYLLNGMSAAHIDPQFQLDLTRWELIISIGIDSIPGLFMIYCFLIFQEEQKFPYTLGIAFAARSYYITPRCHATSRSWDNMVDSQQMLWINLTCILAGILITHENISS